MEDLGPWIVGILIFVTRVVLPLLEKAKERQQASAEEEARRARILTKRAPGAPKPAPRPAPPVAAPPVVSVSVPVHTGMAYVLLSSEHVALASLTGLPWQARAPPSFS